MTGPNSKPAPGVRLHRRRTVGGGSVWSIMSTDPGLRARYIASATPPDFSGRESLQEFNRRARRQEWFAPHPVTPVSRLNVPALPEVALIETMAACRWRLLRLWAMETHNLDYEMRQQRQSHPPRLPPRAPCSPSAA